MPQRSYTLTQLIYFIYQSLHNICKCISVGLCEVHMTSTNKSNNHQIRNSRFIWLAIYLGFSLNLIKAEILLRKARVGGIRGLYKSTSSLRREFTDMRYHQTRFYCMNSGKEHRKASCPRCGSKIKRVGL